MDPRSEAARFPSCGADCRLSWRSAGRRRPVSRLGIAAISRAAALALAPEGENETIATDQALSIKSRNRAWEGVQCRDGFRPHIWLAVESRAGAPARRIT